MDDNVSHESDESVNLSDGFEIIQTGEPELNIAGNGSIDDLKQSLNEILMDSEMPVSGIKIETTSQRYEKRPVDESGHVDSNKLSWPEKAAGETEDARTADRLRCADRNDDDVSILETNTASSELNKSCVSSLSNPMSNGNESTLFFNIIYLGAATVNDGRNEKEMRDSMGLLNAQAVEHAIQVTLSVPSTSEGSVILFEPNSSQEIASFKIHGVSYCVGGKHDTPEALCFAFSCSHGDKGDNSIFHQCHVFKCNSEDEVRKIVMCLVDAFGCGPKTMRPQPISNIVSTEIEKKVQDKVFQFEVTLEIREEDAKGNFNATPKDKTCFKLRCKLLKTVVITVQQITNTDLLIERCFGLLVSIGHRDKSIEYGDMHLLEDVSMTVLGGERKQYVISGQLDPNDPVFEELNVETKDNRIAVNVAVDLIISEIQVPVRFCMETKAKIFPQTERFWYFTRKHLTELFYMHLQEVNTNDGKAAYELKKLENRGEPEYKRLGLTLNLRSVSYNLIPPISTPIDQDEDSDNDEPLLSGSGEVSKDCSEGELEDWADFLKKWPTYVGVRQRPKQLVNLVRKGIPEALRGEVWPRLVGVSDDSEMMDTYRILITKDSSCEQVIQRDINRTFPAHEFFKENGGSGQDALYKISKAYSIYDEEVGYCQGLSFLAAALLLHMPEEQAFCVLVKIMFDYHLRDLFKDNFEVLHLRFYQLEKMMEDQIPDLYLHFMDMGVEAHMFGSQWFLTLFTAKFPLFLVFHILDIFLCEGTDTIFQIALSLLMMSKKELLTMDFEGILKYFRVALPKKYRSEETAKQLLRLAVTIKLQV